MLEIRNLSAGYGKTEVVSGLSLHLSPGELVGIVGPNGCGKSTLLKAIPGILPPMGGEVRADGKAVAAMSARETAKKIAYFSQNRSVPPMTVGELVLHGRYAHHTYPVRYGKEDREIARKAMEKMGIMASSDQPLATLSGGMRQMAYLAMTLAQGSDYLLLDEPSSFLDVVNRLTLMRTLSHLAREGRGILMVLHDLPLAMTYCHKVALMKEGRLLTMDSPEAIAATGLAEQLFGVPLKKDGHNWMHLYES